MDLPESNGQVQLKPAAPPAAAARFAVPGLHTSGSATCRAATRSQPQTALLRPICRIHGRPPIKTISTSGCPWSRKPRALDVNYKKAAIVGRTSRVGADLQVPRGVSRPRRSGCPSQLSPVPPEQLHQFLELLVRIHGVAGHHRVRHAVLQVILEQQLADPAQRLLHRRHLREECRRNSAPSSTILCSPRTCPSMRRRRFNALWRSSSSTP